MSFFSSPEYARAKLEAVHVAAPELELVFVTDLVIDNHRSSYIAGAGGIKADWLRRFENEGVALGCCRAQGHAELEIQNRADVEQAISVEFIWAPLWRVVSSP